MNKFAHYSIHFLTDIVTKPSFKRNSMLIHTFLMQFMETISGQQSSQKSAKAIKRAIPDFIIIIIIVIIIIIIIIIIITHCASRHIRLSHCLPNPLSCAAALAMFQLFHPALPLFLLKVPLQVVFGLPLALRPSCVHPNAIKQSFTPSLLSMCPNQFHLLLSTLQLTSLISAISTTLLFVILAAI